MEHELRPQTGAERARFFQRIFAALIDSILLGLIFIFIVVPSLGWYAPETLLTQSLINFAYYALLNSSLAGGATLGKRVMGICVVNRQGDYIGFPRAMLRGAVDLLPGALGIYIPFLLPAISWPVAEIGSAISVAFVLANIYLYIFNLQTRQILHDLIAGTFVVRAETSVNAFEAKTPFGHVAFVAVLIAAIGLVDTRVELFHEAVNGPVLCAQPISEAARALPFVNRAYADLTPLKFLKISGADNSTVVAFVTGNGDYKQAQLLAKTSIAACPALRDQRLLNIVLIPRQKGYSLRPSRREFGATVAEWRDNLDYVSRMARKDGPCTKTILDAVKTLPFAAKVSMTEGELALGKGHYKEIVVTGPVGKREPSQMAQNVAQKALTACPAIADDEAIDVIIRPEPPTRLVQSFNASAKEWRARNEQGEKRDP